MDVPDFEAVQRATARLAGVAHRTPVLTSRSLDAQLGASVALKAECFQRIGAFKFRGAYNHLSARTRADSVLTTSSGNHAQAVALAAALLGRKAVVLMPADAPDPKRAATLGYGAEVITFDRYGEDREELTARVAAERGLPVLHAYDDPYVIAGQGTVALELIDEAGPLDLLVVPVGGGGLIAGCALAAAARSPGCAVVGVEPEARPAARAALAAGRPVAVPVPRTIADGQQTAAVGARNLAIMRADVEAVVGVSDDEIIEAMRWLFERMKVVAEPSGATAVAALLAGRVEAAGRRVGVVVSGGNVDAALFAELAGRSAG